MEIPKLSFRRHRVDLTHVSAFVLLLDIANVQNPCAVLVMGNRYPRIPGYHMVMYCQYCRLLEMHPSYLQEQQIFPFFTNSIQSSWFFYVAFFTNNCPIWQELFYLKSKIAEPIKNTWIFLCLWGVSRNCCNFGVYRFFLAQICITQMEDRGALITRISVETKNSTQFPTKY